MVNVGIREQLLVNVGAGMALTGMRPIVHTFGSFLVERAFEQVKLGFGHQDVGGVLVGLGWLVRQRLAWAAPTRRPATSRCWTPSPACTSTRRRRPPRSTPCCGAPSPATGCTTCAWSARPTRSPSPARGFHVVRRGAGATVLALGPVLDAVLAATEGLDVTVLYAHTVRPFDARGLRAVLATPDVVLVEPWLAGTSAHVVADALRDLPHRLLSLGVGREELRRYGTPADHVRAHGLDAAGLRRSLDGFLPLPPEVRVPEGELRRTVGHVTGVAAPTSMWPRSGTPGRGRCSSVGRAFSL